MIFYGAKMDVVQFATALQLHSKDAWQSTMITRVGISEVYSVYIATGILLDDIVKKEAQIYSLQPTNIWSGNIPVIKSLRR